MQVAPPPHISPTHMKSARLLLEVSKDNHEQFTKACREAKFEQGLGTFTLFFTVNIPDRAAGENIVRQLSNKALINWWFIA